MGKNYPNQSKSNSVMHVSYEKQREINFHFGTGSNGWHNLFKLLSSVDFFSFQGPLFLLFLQISKIREYLLCKDLSYSKIQLPAFSWRPWRRKEKERDLSTVSRPTSNLKRKERSFFSYFSFSLSPSHSIVFLFHVTRLDLLSYFWSFWLADSVF